MKRLNKKAGSKVQVKQIKSAAGRDPMVHKTLHALGLGRIGKERTFTLNPALNGMLSAVSYLLDVRDVK